MRAIFLMMVLAGSARAQTCPSGTMIYGPVSGWTCSSSIPAGNAYNGTMLPAPAFQAQLDRIESMLKAMCSANTVRLGDSVGTLSGCPKEPKQ